MQVKKYEAKTMKGALDLVKGELGPDAIILSVKDNQSNFGLLSQESVEITAAISEKSLQKKRIAEKRMGNSNLNKYKNSSASKQKEYINQVYDRITETHKKEQSRTQQKYIDIDDSAISAPAPIPAVAKIENIFNPVVNSFSASSVVQSPPKNIQANTENEEVLKLKNEITRLNEMIADFQKVPQSFISVHPGANRGIPYEFSFIYSKLNDVGVGEDTIVSLIELAQREVRKEDHGNRHLIDAFIAQKILDTTNCCERPGKGMDKRIHVFVGPSGQGKTSSLVKMASKLVIEDKKRVAILTADTFKVGGSDQLKIFAQILNVPFAVVRKRSDWTYLLENLQDYDYLLLDFPSLQLKDGNELSLAQKLMPPKGESVSTHFVTSVTAKSENIFELGRRYRALQISDVIFTSLDESVQHGLIYDFHKKFNLPIHSFGIGPKIPEDYEYASKERVLDLLFKLT